jgi:hypothetical protein
MFGRSKSIEQSSQDNIKTSIEFLSWIQEFSKKIVFVTFLIFVLANLFFIVIVTLDFIRQGTIQYLDTYISEIHLTFREVIGGYLIKAASENVVKIGGSYMESYMKDKHMISKDTTFTTSDTSEDNDES